MKTRDPTPSPSAGAPPRSDDRCAHCGLPVPPALRRGEAAESFCCRGCEVVHHAIRGCGLDRFYELRERRGERGAPAAVTGGRFESFDDPAFRDLYVREAPGGRSTVELYLEGVHCSACLWLVERLPLVLPGVAEARLDFRRRLATITWDDAAVPLSAVARRLDGFGYPPRPHRGRTMRDLRRAEDRRWLVRIAVAGAIAGNVMVIAFALYGGAFHGMEPRFEALFRGASLALTLVSLAWPGRTFFRGAIAALRTRTSHMDLPIALGLAGGTLFSAVNTLRGAGEVYFESLTILVFLLLVGRFIQIRRQRASSDAVELLYTLTPRVARRLEDGRAREVPLEAIDREDVVEVRAGESVPADGTVQRGESAVDLSMLTGESRAVPVGPGDRVHAGTVNLERRLEVLVAATGRETRAGRLMDLVERCAAERAPVVQTADRIAGVFVVVVIVLAIATAAGWWAVAPGRAIDAALALLIITCPCALGLATPLAIMVGIGRAAGRGILIKGGETIERLAVPGLALLDKTGTLTEGRLSLARWHGPEELKPMVAAAEAHASHPVARAMAAALGPAPAELEVESVEVHGSGVTARVAGRALLMGSPSYLAERGATVPPDIDDVQHRLTAEALTPVLVAVDGTARAAAGFGDALRPEAAEVVRRLERAGWTVGVLSGDHPEVVDAVGERIGVPPSRRFGGVAAEEKIAVVRREAARGPVMMVGDGVNDAAALAAATVGVSVSGGAEASLEAADVFLGRPGLSALPDLVAGARGTLRVVRRGLVVSLVYNAVGATLAVAGLINPLAAAVLMPLSSLTVITLACRQRGFGEP